MMELFYLREHTSCYNYSKCVQEGFRYYKLPKGVQYAEQIPKNGILFVISGRMSVSCNEYDFILSASEMVFIHRNSFFKAALLEDGELIVALFETGGNICQKASLTELYELKELLPEHRTEPLNIRVPLDKYLELLIEYLKSGANCIHFHEMKLMELFWIFRFYYTKTEMLKFFYPIITASHNFRDKILIHYQEARTIKELSESCGISFSAFKKQFIAEFGEAPSIWIQKQKLGAIKHKLQDPNLSLGEIADELNFPSLSQFSKYCKQHLGLSPKELRLQLKE